MEIIVEIYSQENSQELFSKSMNLQDAKLFVELVKAFGFESADLDRYVFSNATTNELGVTIYVNNE